MKRHFLRAVGVFTAALMLCVGALPIYAEEPNIDCSIEGNCFEARPLKVGDVVQYDNSVSGWDTVKVYIFGYQNPFVWGQTPYEAGYAFEWSKRPKMTNISGTDIWEYKVPTMEGYCRTITDNNSDYQACVDYYSTTFPIDSICGYYTLSLPSDSYHECIEYYSKYNGESMSYYEGLWSSLDGFVFTDNEGGTYDDGKQTSDTLFFGSEYIFRSNCIVGTPGCLNQANVDGGKYYGYWYLYDKSGIIDLLSDAKAYADKISCVDEEEAKAFINLVNDFDDKIGKGFVVKQDATSHQYYTDYDMDYDALNAQIASIKEKYGENPSLCKDKDNPDTFDSIGLFVGLGAASFAGLVIGLNRKRRA